jgi:hypothetical protein
MDNVSGKGKGKGGAACRIGGHFEFAAVSPHNRSADGKPEAHTLRLGRGERLKKA